VVKKKHFSYGPEVFFAFQPAPLSRMVLAFRFVNSGRDNNCVALLIFSEIAPNFAPS
jgi:hypothetical protein